MAKLKFLKQIIFQKDSLMTSQRSHVKCTILSNSEEIIKKHQNRKTKQEIIDEFIRTTTNEEFSHLREKLLYVSPVSIQNDNHTLLESQEKQRFMKDKMNADQQVLQKRDQNFDRLSQIRKQALRHGRKECNCRKKNKQCVGNGKIDLDRITENGYLLTIASELEFVYHVCQSATQSMRSTTGNEFERVISDILSDNNISHATQVHLCQDGRLSYKKREGSHRVDIVIPKPKEGDNASNYNIVSCKTKLRERYLQDKFLPCPYTLISLEDLPYPDPQITLIHIQPDGDVMQRWIDHLRSHSSFSKMI